MKIKMLLILCVIFLMGCKSNKGALPTDFIPDPVSVNVYDYPRAKDFNNRFQRMSDLISYITFQDSPPLTYFIDGEYYYQHSVNYNFDVLLDQLEKFVMKNYNKGYIYRKELSNNAN